uniref:Transmembrane protein n=1 Tax=Strongyloides stercoralis TaxID=6248 RepID=A0A0K0E3T9_STRER
MSNNQLHHLFSLETFLKNDMYYWYKIITFISYIQCTTFTLFFASLHSIYLILYYKNFIQDLKLKNLSKLYLFFKSFDFLISVSFIYIIGTLLCFFGYIIGYNQKQEVVFTLYGYGIGGFLLLNCILMNLNKFFARKNQNLPTFCCQEEE